LTDKETATGGAARGEGRDSGNTVSNTLVQLLPPGVRLPLGLLLTALLTRYLGPRGFGEYATIFALVALYQGIFNDVGLSTIVLREIARHPENRSFIVVSAATLQTIVAAITYGLLLVGVAIIHYPSDIAAGVVVLGLSLFLTPLDILSLTFTADLKLAKLIPPSLVGITLNFGLVAGSLTLHASLPVIVFAVLVATLVQYAIVASISIKALAPLARPSRAPWRWLLVESLPLAANSLLVAFTLQAPLLYLSHLSFAEAGLFNAANRLPQQLILLPFAVRATTFPLLARSWHRDRRSFRRHLTRTVAVTLLVGVPITVGGVGLAPVIVPVLFGTKFAAASMTLQLLLVVFALQFPYIIVAEALIATGHQRVILWLSVVTVPLLMGGLLVGANTAGAVGTAIALLAYYVGLLSATLLVARLKVHSRGITRDVVVAMLVLLMGVLLVTKFADPPRSDPAQALVAVGAAAVVGVLMLLIHRETGLDLLHGFGATLTRITGRLRT
jgi:O-antigen/teichoic acid export membrane protein